MEKELELELALNHFLTSTSGIIIQHSFHSEQKNLIESVLSKLGRWNVRLVTNDLIKHQDGRFIKFKSIGFINLNDYGLKSDDLFFVN